MENIEKLNLLESKVIKLKRLMLLTDSVVSHMTPSETQLLQWEEFIKVFPEEGEK